MDFERAAELLPFYLNGSLSSEERAEVEATLADSPELRRELAATRAAAEIYRQRLAPEALTDYVAGEPAGEIPQALLERLIAEDPRYQEEVALLRESYRAALGEESTAAERPELEARVLKAQFGPSRQAPRRWLALAAALAAVAVAGVLAWSVLSPSGPGAKAPQMAAGGGGGAVAGPRTLTLVPLEPGAVLRGPSSGAPDAERLARQGALRLVVRSLHLEPGTAVRLELEDAHGAKWQSAPLPATDQPTLELTLAASELAPGAVELRLLEAASGKPLAAKAVELE
ncbi:MAG: hypothetical protein U0002_20500 [Thermoanaerobaculia bacterium]